MARAREALVGVALSGLVVGSVVAALRAPVGHVGAKQGAAGRASGAAATPGGTAAGGRARDQGTAIPLTPREMAAAADREAEARVAFEAALRGEVAKDPWLRDVRAEMHVEIGAGALAWTSGPTRAGFAVLARAREAADHGLDSEDYGLPALDLAARAFEDGAPAARGADAGDLGRKAAALEAALGRALLRAVLDFRFLRVAGPFDLAADEAELVANPKRRAEVLKAAREIATAADPEAAVRALDPRHPSYRRLLEVLAHYRAVAAKGCDRPLDEGWRLKPGVEGEPVRALAERLACEGYFTGTPGPVYDEALLRAVQDYQAHHELEPDGYVYEGTLQSLNVPLAKRVAQIELGLRRMRESPARELGDPWIRVNLPAFELQFIEAGKVLRRHRVIVGTNKLDDDKVRLVQGHINRTELFTTKLYHVVINPPWYVPERVEKGEVKAAMAQDPDYLAKKKIEVQRLADGTEVYVMAGGDDSVLGKVKFLLERSKAIFLHDTDKPLLFRERRRDFSHGCIRVEGAVELAKWILERDGHAPASIEHSFKTRGSATGMKLRRPIDLVTEYATVDVAEDGGPVFLTDIYGYDRAYRDGALPPKVFDRWGGSQLRPSWVPSVPPDVVEDWRARGLAAPHDYDPEKHGTGKRAPLPLVRSTDERAEGARGGTP